MILLSFEINEWSPTVYEGLTRKLGPTASD